MQNEYSYVFVSRNDDTETYTLTGIPQSGIHEPKQDIQEICKASYLFVNDIGFACESAEFSQHNETITIKQDTDGGSANIIVDSSN